MDYHRKIPLPLKKTYKCPHCFHSFRAAEASFRCASIAQVCTHSIDEIYDTFHGGEKKKQGRVFSPKKKGLKASIDSTGRAACDECASLTDVRVCPHCHHNLPASFWSADFVSIGVVCQRVQELEAYVQYLQKVLASHVAYDLNFVLKPEKNSTNLEIYLEPLKDKGATLHVRFYPLDAADLQTPENGFYDGLLFLVDKANCMEARPYVPEALQNLICGLQGRSASRGVRAEKFSIPLGVTYACVENLAPFIPQRHVLLSDGHHVGGYAADEGARISSDLLAYTGSWFGANLLQLMKRYFSRYRLFGISFCYPETQPFLPNAGWRIEDPFLWVLWVLKKIGKAKD